MPHIEKVANLGSPHFHNVLKGLPRAILSEFVEGLMFGVANLLIAALGQWLQHTGDNFGISKAFLTYRIIVQGKVFADSFRRPLSSQKVGPVQLQVVGGVMWNQMHRLKPIVGIPKFGENQRVVGILGGVLVLKPMLVSGQISFYLPK